jgi:Holliday junction resolvase RusA-like endonuclease
MSDVKSVENYLIQVNPQPWAIGPLGTGRRNGKVYPYVGPNQKLVAYQEAVREELEAHNEEIYEGPIKLDFFFWRNRTGHDNIADVTNLIKGTEDALQGVLIKNDRQTVSVSGLIVEQGPDIEGQVLITVTYDYTPGESFLAAVEQLAIRKASPVQTRTPVQPTLWNENPEDDF